MIYELGKICSRLSSGKSINAREITSKGIFPVFGGNGIRGYTNRKNFDGECAIIGRQGAYCGNVRYFSGEAYMTEHAVVVCANENNNTRYLAYLLSTMNLGRLSSQSAQPGLSVRTLSQQKVSIPPLEVQKKISAILSPLDDKIELNGRINDNLEEQARAIFKHWLIDSDYRLGIASEIIEYHDSKRIPISSRERSKLAKIYPYYGAASVMDYVDRYIFDGVYLLLGEDGTVTDSKGFPILQYVDGKFWVNNHAHVLTGRNGFSVELLYLLFSMTNVQSVVTGAVQPKISQASLNSVAVVIPPESELQKLDSIIQPLFSMIRNLRKENNTLAKIRDSLIPKLISGEINIV